MADETATPPTPPPTDEPTPPEVGGPSWDVPLGRHFQHIEAFVREWRARRRAEMERRAKEASPPEPEDPAAGG
jgi:hypothetical protein